MHLTRHAEKRLNQRGFSKFTLDIILKNGRVIKAPGGAERIFFGNKEHQKSVSELKKAIQLLDKAKNSSMIIVDGEIITVYKF